MKNFEVYIPYSDGDKTYLNTFVANSINHAQDGMIELLDAFGKIVAIFPSGAIVLSKDAILKTDSKNEDIACNIEQKFVSIEDLLKIIGGKNVFITRKPIFEWDGNTVDVDKNNLASATVKHVEDYKLKENESIIDFIKERSDKKIIFYIPLKENKIITDEYNHIRVCVIDTE